MTKVTLYFVLNKLILSIKSGQISIIMWTIVHHKVDRFLSVLKRWTYFHQFLTASRFARGPSTGKVVVVVVLVPILSFDRVNSL